MCESTRYPPRSHGQQCKMNVFPLPDDLAMRISEHPFFGSFSTGGVQFEVDVPGTEDQSSPAPQVVRTSFEPCTENEGAALYDEIHSSIS